MWHQPSHRSPPVGQEPNPGIAPRAPPVLSSKDALLLPKRHGTRSRALLRSHPRPALPRKPPPMPRSCLGAGQQRTEPMERRRASGTHRYFFLFLGVVFFALTPHT